MDKFHFKKNHTAAYCEANTNPYRVPLLDNDQTNMSVAEQRFKHVARYKHIFRCLSSGIHGALNVLQARLVGQHPVLPSSRCRIPLKCGEKEGTACAQQGVGDLQFNVACCCAHRHMNKARFNFMLTMLAWADQEFAEST